MNYREQIKNLCIATFYNLHGVMPTPSELTEMIGDDDRKQDPQLEAA